MARGCGFFVKISKKMASRVIHRLAIDVFINKSTVILTVAKSSLQAKTKKDKGKIKDISASCTP